jgi:hypothetical protein
MRASMPFRHAAQRAPFALLLLFAAGLTKSHRDEMR